MGIAVVETSQQKSKKSSRDKTVDIPVAIEAGPSNAEDEGKEKKGKKKRRVDEGVADGELDNTRVFAEGNIADITRQEKKKRRSERKDGEEDATTNVEVDMAEGGGEKKRKKDKKGKEREEAEMTVATTSEDKEEGASKKKSKKRKTRKEDNSQEIAEEEAKPKKKRKRSSSGFPDPGEDDSLSDQARKALSYAYLQAEEPLSWKFNKARQNWLLRNVWSAEAIPDTYVSLTKKYLSSVQGGVRETLIKTCHDVLAEKPQEEAKPQIAAELAPVESEDKPAVKTNAKVKFDVPTEIFKASITLQSKQQRAQELLEVFTSEKAS
ncbi:uncharacterized protein PHACADRAFT_249966 [Phanerochaete carnosa HHB-10118-sp]|uniref:WKF domain-containing protein n=1 Tax=Phanerochaete carnosa (strain HHB-10118-sp) TaxID=650164 RepID=K5V9F8_PHACS|nr:uncharacterized protein PHACADRAFT_249966 [Phanerochaete carnosa HHB-10118-sp]EKM59461.1 hypothetical protein PHACADRAFT_249966 [Phanerochaete carnosa HHB-10118-sp]